MNKPTVSGGSSKSGSHDRPPPEAMARSSAVFGFRGRRRPPGVAAVRCEVRSPVQQIAEFLEAVAERALFARRDDQGAAFEASRGPLEDRVFDDRLQEFSGADLDEQGAALLLEGSSVRCEFLEPAGDLFWQRASVMPLQEVGYAPEVFAALHLVQHTCPWRA
jgi:hypothetical protein